MVVTGSSCVNEPDRQLHLAVAENPGMRVQLLTRSEGLAGRAEARGGNTSAGAQRAASGKD